MMRYTKRLEVTRMPWAPSTSMGVRSPGRMGDKVGVASALIVFANSDINRKPFRLPLLSWCLAEVPQNVVALEGQTADESATGADE